MPRHATRLTLRLSVAALALFATAAAASTLDAVKQKGSLACGVSQGLPGFSDHDAAGKWSGFDVDFCRAVAAAIFDDPNKVTYVPLNAAERFEALHAGKIDLLSRNSSWTFDREASLGLLFAAITYHDGQGFMVLRKPEITSALELDKASICVQKGTTSELNLADYFRANSMTYTLRAYDTIAEVIKALEGGECDVFSTDQSGLYAERGNLSQPNAAVILPDIISKEPLGPVVRQGDDKWFTVVKWVLFAMINAEELNITSKNADDMMKSTNPDVKRFVGTEGNYGEQLALAKDWAVRIIKLVGNYGEVFERNVGQGSPLKIDRGLNKLWNKGGIQYAPPIR